MNTNGDVGFKSDMFIQNRELFNFLPDGETSIDGAVQVKFAMENRHDRVPDKFVNITSGSNDMFDHDVKIIIQQAHYQVSRFVFTDGREAADINKNNSGHYIFIQGQSGFKLMAPHKFQYC